MSILLFFIVLLVLVIAHEFGHFIVAKRSGIRVDEFAFGFPPKLFSRKHGETTYSFNALPIGGYVKIYGENPDEVTDEDKKRSFGAQPLYIQGAVIVAGVLFNLLLAWVLISGTLVIGIQAVDDSEHGLPVSGTRLTLTNVEPRSPAANAGLSAGDVLISLTDGSDSITAETPERVSSFVRPREGRPIFIAYEHKGEHKETSATPISGIIPGGGAIGITMDMVGTLKLPIHKAITEGAVRTYNYTRMTITGLYDFFSGVISGKSDFSQVTGPVGIVNAVGDAAGLGFAFLLQFTALISINLAVINILPFPALDGGRLLFVIIEAIMRRPIPAKISNAVNFAGLALLMLLMVAVTWHDVAKLL